MDAQKRVEADDLIEKLANLHAESGNPDGLLIAVTRAQRHAHNNAKAVLIAKVNIGKRAEWPASCR